MEKDEIDFGLSLTQLSEFGVTNAAKLTPYPGLVDVFQQYSDYNTQYIKLGGEQTTPIKGSTQVKSAARISLENIMMSIGRPASGVFFKLGKFDLQLQVACKPAMLTGMRDTTIIAKASIIITVCTDNIADLTAVSITLPKIAALETAKDTFATNNPIPNTKIKGRADVGTTIKSLQKEIRTFTEKVASEQMYVFELIDKPLLLSFQHLAQQIHTGGRRRPSAVQTTKRSVQLLSDVTNQNVVGIVQVLEKPKSYMTNINGLAANIVFPLGTCTIQVQAFGFQNYSGTHVIDPLNTTIITILLIPIVPV